MEKVSSSATLWTLRSVRGIGALVDCDGYSGHLTVNNHLLLAILRVTCIPHHDLLELRLLSILLLAFEEHIPVRLMCQLRGVPHVTLHTTSTPILITFIEAIHRLPNTTTTILLLLLINDDLVYLSLDVEVRRASFF